MIAIKVFQVNMCDCWAGYDLESCIQAAMKETGMDRDEFTDDWARELTDEEMDRRMFTDDDGQSRTFREQWALYLTQDITVPFFFSSTEF